MTGIRSVSINKHSEAACVIPFVLPFVHSPMSHSFFVGIGLLIVLTGDVWAANLSFAPKTLLLGSTPRSIQLADFNGDHQLDIAVVNGGGVNQNSVTVRLGEGNRTFANPITTATGGLGAWDMTIADFNHDGKLDVAVTNNLGNNVSILLGNGDGTFRTAVLYPVHGGPTAIAAGDFNRDGHPDLAVVNSSTGDLSILLGNGDGTFRQGTLIPLGSSPTAVAVCDLNANGVLDLAVTNGALGLREVQILAGNGDGTFRAQQTVAVGNEPFAVAVGDFNHDGRPDLGVANLASNNVSVLLSDTSGGLSPAVNYAAGNGPTGIRAASLTPKAPLSLIVSNDVSNTVAILTGNGDGTFQTAVSFPSGGYSNSIAVGDLDNDGYKDIAVANQGSITILFNTTTTTTTTSLQMPATFRVAPSTLTEPRASTTGPIPLDLISPIAR